MLLDQIEGHLKKFDSNTTDLILHPFAIRGGLIPKLCHEKANVWP